MLRENSTRAGCARILYIYARADFQLKARTFAREYVWTTPTGRVAVPAEDDTRLPHMRAPCVGPGIPATPAHRSRKPATGAGSRAPKHRQKNLPLRGDRRATHA